MTHPNPSRTTGDHTMSRGVLLVSLIVGCYATSATMLNPAAQNYPTVDAAHVRIFTTFTELDRLGLEYVRVAIIHGEGKLDGLWTSDAGLFDAMKKKAADIGCNAVVLSVEAGAAGGERHGRQGDAIGVVVKDANWE